MSGGNKATVRIGLIFGVLVSTACGENSSPAEKVPSPPAPLATLDIKNTASGSIPGGSTKREGKWQVTGEVEELQVLPEPLVISWLEFGPEVRGKGATIVATGRSSGGRRLQSRFGAGLYGRNGFQIRLVPLTDEIELVRRQEVLRKVSMKLESDRLYTIELTVRGEEDQWIIRGHVWEAEEDPETGTAIGFQIYEEELLFPLAGRAVLTGTPFSGKPVGFTAAEVYPEGYVRKVEPENADDSEDDKTADESN